MKNPPEPPARDLAGYEVLVGVCGGIAAYKTCQVVSELVQRGAAVTVAMTAAARKFVSALTFQSLSGRPVLTSLWKAPNPADVQHIAATETADLLLVAPATANLLGKAAAGIADDLLSTLLIAAGAPVLLAPAMNVRMWANSIVQRNVSVLKEHGFAFVGPGEGWLACRSVGVGRMAEPEDILRATTSMLRERPPRRAPGGG